MLPISTLLPRPDDLLPQARRLRAAPAAAKASTSPSAALPSMGVGTVLAATAISPIRIHVPLVKRQLAAVLPAVILPLVAQANKSVAAIKSTYQSTPLFACSRHPLEFFFFSWPTWRPDSSALPFPRYTHIVIL